MTDNLNFNLPDRQSPSAGTSYRLVIIINLIILVVACAIFAFILLQSSEVLSPETGPSLSGEAQKQLALKLERQGLNDVSASAWEQYLAQARPQKAAAARIWFRIGKLYQDADQYDKALAAYYRSERFARIPALSPDLGRRVQECLESMGKFAALRDELAERVGLKGSGSGGKSAGENTVVAEIGSRKITLADLDHLIDQAIDRRLYRMNPDMPKDAFDQEKEKLFEAFSTTPKRMDFLRQYLAQTLLYREAIAEKLMDAPGVRSEIKAAEQSLLAEREIEKTYAREIHITNGDLKNYYAAHKDAYLQPERAKISLIVVKNTRAAKKVRAALKQGKNFAELARRYSTDTASAQNGGRIDTWINKGDAADIPEIGRSKAAATLIFTTKAGSVAAQNVLLKNGIAIVRVDQRQPEQQKPFDSVKDEVNGALLARKEQAVRNDLLNRLKDKYNVVIHASALAPRQGETAGSAAAAGTSAGKIKQN